MAHQRKTIAPGVTLLYGVPDECCLYLVEGASGALLIDTGFGTQDIAAEVAGLTALPLRVVNTHGHGDHSGGDLWFPEVYMHKNAEPDARASLELNRTVLPEAEIRRLEEKLAGGSFQARHVRDGDVFDLGGRSLTVLEIPGHTGGCIALLDSAARLVFTGDCVVTTMDILLTVPQARPLAEYRASMRRLQARKAAFDGLCTGHDLSPLPNAILDEAVALCDGILDGRITGEDIELPPVFGDPHAKRAQGEHLAISYRPL